MRQLILSLQWAVIIVAVAEERVIRMSSKERVRMRRKERVIRMRRKESSYADETKNYEDSDDLCG